MELNDQLTNENSKLMSDMHSLRDSVQELEEELSVTRITSKELTKVFGGVRVVVGAALSSRFFNTVFWVTLQGIHC